MKIFLSKDGRNKRSRSTMQYIDSQVDISDEEPSQKIFSRSTIHIGETIETQFDTPITDQVGVKRFDLGLIRLTFLDPPSANSTFDSAEKQNPR